MYGKGSKFAFSILLGQDTPQTNIAVDSIPKMNLPAEIIEEKKKLQPAPTFMIQSSISPKVDDFFFNKKQNTDPEIKER